MATYITGDPHGSTARIAVFCSGKNLSEDDILVLLGDVGANYFLDFRDLSMKEELNALGPEMLCIHGNHEARPWHMLGCTTKEWHGGIVYYEEEFPHVLYAKDGEIYRLEGKACMAIGGAYSVDRQIRLARGWHWFPDEQPSDEIKAYVEEQLRRHTVDVIFSHTCPADFRPVECFLPGLDQSRVDTSTEDWLDQIEKRTGYETWYCGHWHINKIDQKIHFLLDQWEQL